ncbi:MAG: hypothetical protein OXL34_17710 [Gemmatimonadota bacterium]|nr:hypothetical protein [Gemmatimonadota bacterium]
MTAAPIPAARRRNLSRVALLAFSVAPLGVFACSTGHTEEGESGIRYALTDTAMVVRDGVKLVAWYDASRDAFLGTVTNTTDATIQRVRVEIHLSNGTELGPTPNVDLDPGESDGFELNASGQSFVWWSIHVEIGSDSG